MKRTIVFLLAFTAWATPIHAVSALKQSNEIDTTFINYQEIRERPKTNNEGQGDRGTTKSVSSRILQSTPTSTSQYSGRHYSKEEVQQLIIQYSSYYGIASDTPLCIAKLESGYNQFSKNSRSTASGVFQYLNGTWSSTDEGKAGLSVWDADANVRAAIKYMGIHKNTRPWVVAPKCPKLTFLK